MEVTARSTYVALFAVFFLAIASFTLPLMAGLYIVGELGGSNEISTYNIAFYGFGNALSIPLGKILPSRIGAVRSLWMCLVLFSIFSLLCALSPNYPFYVAMRFLKGISLGPLFIIIMLLFRNLLREDQLAQVASVNMIMFSAVPAAAACWGGWISYDYHWANIFYFNIPVALFLAWFIHHRLKDAHIEMERYRFDGVGYLFYSTAIICLGFALTIGQEFDWFRSEMITALICIGTLSLLFFLGWSWNHEDPVIQLKLFQRPLFFFGIVNLSILFLTYFAAIILLSLWLHLYANYTPHWIAVILGVMAASCALPSIIIRKELAYIDGRLPLCFALIFMAISCFYATSFDMEIDLQHLAVSRIYAGLSLVCFLPSVFRICFHVVPEENYFEVFSCFQVVRVLSSSLGASLFTILWQRREVFYHDRLGGQLNVFSESTKEFFVRAFNFQLQGKSALTQLNTLLDKQATSLALADCFYLMGWLVVGLIALMGLTLFLRKRKDGIEERVLKLFLFKE